MAIKDWRCKDLICKEDNAAFTTYDLVDIAGGVWYGTTTINKWQEEVEAGASPEIDRVKYYVGLFKDQEGSYSVMQLNKPKRSTISEQVTDDEDEAL